MRHDAKRRGIVAKRQDRLQRVERVEVLARILLARGAVPRIVNDNFRREVSDTGSKLLPETVTSKAKTVRRRRTDAHIFFESVAVQFRKFSGKAKLTVLRLHNHGLKFPVQREAEPFVGGCACFSERDSGARFSNARCATDHKHRAFDDVAIADQHKTGRRREVFQLQRRTEFDQRTLGLAHGFRVRHDIEQVAISRTSEREIIHVFVQHWNCGGFDGAILNVCANILRPLLAGRVVLWPQVSRRALRYQTGNERAIRSAPRDDDAGAFAVHAHESESVPLRFENVNGARIQFTDHKRARLRALWHVSP